MAKLSTASKTIERADGTLETIAIALNRQRQINKSHEIYLGLYQALTGPEERQKLYKEFSPGFFALIVVDECHRGSAEENSAWREILTYFIAATQIGLTATPKETKYVSNIEYFGEPLYTYSLNQGIRDGFLAPYKVIRVHLDLDVEGYRPKAGELDDRGVEIEDRLYNQKDFDRVLVIDARTLRVAKWISDYLKASGDRMQKTIVFCVDTEHALLMRQALINENQDLVAANGRYVMRITGNDEEGMKALDDFIDPLNPYPVLVTTSRLALTGTEWLARVTELGDVSTSDRVRSAGDVIIKISSGWACSCAMRLRSGWADYRSSSSSLALLREGAADAPVFPESTGD